jgi:hypothetical protein
VTRPSARNRAEVLADAFQELGASTEITPRIPQRGPKQALLTLFGGSPHAWYKWATILVRHDGTAAVLDARDFESGVHLVSFLRALGVKLVPDEGP